MRESRIQAVDHVHLQAPPCLAEDVHWFYTEVGALETVAGPGDGAARLVYRSERIELRVALQAAVVVDSVPRRVTLAVPSLELALERLAERCMPYEWQRGLAFSERHVVVLDPARHRVLLKQDTATGLL